MLVPRPLLEPEKFIDDALIGSETNGIAEEPGDGAEIATVGAASAGFDRYNIEALPALREPSKKRMNDPRNFSHHVELLQVEALPWDDGVVHQ